MFRNSFLAYIPTHGGVVLWYTSLREQHVYKRAAKLYAAAFSLDPGKSGRPLAAWLRHATPMETDAGSVLLLAASGRRSRAEAPCVCVRRPKRCRWRRVGPSRGGAVVFGRLQRGSVSGGCNATGEALLGPLGTGLRAALFAIPTATRRWPVAGATAMVSELRVSGKQGL